LMVLAGFGMVVGNLVSGRLSDRFTPGRVAAFTQGSLSILLLLIYFLASISWLSVILMCLCTAGLFALSSPQQVLLIRFSPGGEMLGAASVQVAFNLGNAIGAYCGGLPLQAGLSYRYPALLGTFFALVGFILLVLFSRKYETARQHV
jgi:arabinose efflux porter araJ